MAGTKVYEDRRAESFKILKQTDLRREKINDVISEIETKLQTLEGEKEDLKQYRELDKKRRALTYKIHDYNYGKAQEEVRFLQAFCINAHSLRATRTIIRHNDVSQLENIQDEYKDKNKSAEEENDKVIVRVYSSACTRHAKAYNFCIFIENRARKRSR